MTNSLSVAESRFIHIVKVWVLQSCQSRNAPIRVEGDQARKEVHLKFSQCWCVLDHGHSLELWEGLFEIRQFQGIWPVALVRCTEDLKNFEYLIDLTITHEKRSSLQHLCENTSCRPQVNTKCVGFLTEQDFWTSVPESDDFMRVCLDWQTESSCQSEIS